MIKLIRYIKDRLPISKKQYYNDLKKITLTFQAMAQSEAQHAQIQMNMLQSFTEMQNRMGKAGTPPKKATDPAFG